jgi:hypothetical protein
VDGGEQRADDHDAVYRVVKEARKTCGPSVIGRDRRATRFVVRAPIWREG